MSPKTKEQQIQEFLSKPIKEGDMVNVKNTVGNKEYTDYVEVKKVNRTHVFFRKYGFKDLISVPISDVVRCTDHIGVNPFKSEIRTTSYQIDIEQLLWRCGFDQREREERHEKHFGVPIPETCVTPIVIDEHGNDVEYQRGLVWSLEQKQLLIESIYNNVEIGKFVVRKRSFKWVEQRVKEGKIANTAFNDLVDGKQRFTAIVGFINNEFPDMYENYFNDLSEKSKRKFISYRHLTYVELDENATDKDTLSVFLAINFTGVPMSKEHIEYVKSIKL